MKYEYTTKEYILVGNQVDQGVPEKHVPSENPEFKRVGRKRGPLDVWGDVCSFKSARRMTSLREVQNSITNFWPEARELMNIEIMEVTTTVKGTPLKPRRSK